jgi:outer membrane protein insertion porin family
MIKRLTFLVAYAALFTYSAASAQETATDSMPIKFSDLPDTIVITLDDSDNADIYEEYSTDEEDDASVDTANIDLPTNYSAPKKYIIADISVSGVKYHNTDQIIALSGLSRGDTISIPSEQNAQAMKKLWTNGMFSDVKLRAKRIDGNLIYLDIYLKERYRIVSYSLEGVKKSEREEVGAAIGLRRGSEYSEYLESKAVDAIKKYYIEKGYRNVFVQVKFAIDSGYQNGIRLMFDVNKGKKVRVKEFEFEGNKELSDRQLRKAQSKVQRFRWYTFWRSSKYIDKDLEEDKDKIIEQYQEKGYRDAKIIGDSTWAINDKHIGILYKIYEGRRYYYRKLTWSGNTRYPSEMLTAMLRVKKGDIYDKVTLEKRLISDPDNSVSTLYMDDGYLFFNVQPVEVKVDGDSVDLEMRIFEGKQATINEIVIQGNTKTNEHVVRRELFTRPGDLFSKTHIVRSIRDLAQMGNFDPEKLDVKPVPNQRDETVDIIYVVEEKPTDQLEISGGYGAGTFIGSIGMKFSNFSMRRVLEKGAWRPFPSGDNQTVSIRGQTNGSYYNSVSLSFSEPWLGGKKPISLTTSFYYVSQSNATYLGASADKFLRMVGVSVGVGRRLKFPDNYFTLYHSVDLQQYRMTNWADSYGTPYFMLATGVSNNFSIKTIFGRNSTDQVIYPRRGSEFSLGLQITPPYSLLSGKNYKNASDADKYHWIEYHKWTFTTKWYTQIVGDLVFAYKMQFGYLGYFNSDLGYSPFEGFDVGGDGMGGSYSYTGTELIGLRGYPNSSLTPIYNGQRVAHVFDKFSVEIRYPFVLSPASSIYGLIFFDAGNAWTHLREFDPLSVRRSAGVGVRLILPMLGMLGIDWGYGFDPIPDFTSPTAKKTTPVPSGSNFHFVLGLPF